MKFMVPLSCYLACKIPACKSIKRWEEIEVKQAFYPKLPILGIIQVSMIILDWELLMKELLKGPSVQNKSYYSVDYLPLLCQIIVSRYIPV